MPEMYLCARLDRRGNVAEEGKARHFGTVTEVISDMPSGVTPRGNRSGAVKPTGAGAVGAPRYRPRKPRGFRRGPQQSSAELLNPLRLFRGRL